MPIFTNAPEFLESEYETAMGIAFQRAAQLRNKRMESQGFTAIDDKAKAEDEGYEDEDDEDDD